ncbi:hypothetical protein H4Q26_009824 [Puccinia striiformis f. sp. tritici PST-130]|nr:hypothetical protein H4Q26_009824 [Puccinia striiformis f. sp. tritici PST-130]
MSPFGAPKQTTIPIQVLQKVSQPLFYTPIKGFKTCTPDVLAKYPAIYCSDNPDLAGNVENFPTDQRHDFNAKGPVFTCDYHCIPQCCEGSPGKELIVPHVCTNATDFKPGPTHKQYNLQETN